VGVEYSGALSASIFGLCYGYRTILHVCLAAARIGGHLLGYFTVLLTHVGNHDMPLGMLSYFHYCPGSFRERSCPRLRKSVLALGVCLGFSGKLPECRNAREFCSETSGKAVTKRERYKASVES